MKVTVVNTLAPYQAQTIHNAYGMSHLSDEQKMRVFETVIGDDDEEEIVEHDFPDKYLFMIET